MHDTTLPLQATIKSFSHEKIIMKKNNADFPLYLNYDGRLILEMNSEKAKYATELLIAIAEPVSRPKNIHEYKLTAYSLYAAAASGLNTNYILDTLNSLLKNKIPKQMEKYIRDCTLSYGKVKLVSTNNEYYIVADDINTINRLKRDDIFMTYVQLIEGYHIKINREYLESAKRRTIEIDYPLIDEYYYENNKNVDIKLRPNISIRPYQEEALNKFISGGRACSGIIVLPCGAGKTLVGIGAISYLQSSAIILCTSALSVEQWKDQLIKFTTIKPEKIKLFTSDKKELFNLNDNIILISTYSMLSFSGKRSYDAKQVIENLSKKVWDILIMDEVHVVPAMMFRTVISLINHRCKLGLTATLLREDDRIEDLNFLIGPKLYEADWQFLAANGHIAKVVCSEVWCEMNNMFYKEYLNMKNRRRNILSILNPSKFRACEFLINKYEKMGRKVIVFSDAVGPLKTYALKLGRPFIYGPTGQAERMRILSQFQHGNLINTLFLSKVGDTSLDLPEATVLIQIGSHFGSRRQEAQRLGRILRAKQKSDPNFRVYFYSLLSMDTEEMGYSERRRQFLIDQGYIFKTYLPGEIFGCKNLNFNIANDEIYEEVISQSKLTTEDEKELLMSILLKGITDEVEEVESDLVGANEMAYMEDENKRKRFH